MNVKIITKAVEPLSLDKNHLEGSYAIVEEEDKIIEKYRVIFEENGYNVKLLNIIDPEKSLFKYNPLRYLTNEKDIVEFSDKIVDINFPYVESETKMAAKTLLSSSTCYLMEYSEEKKQTLKNISHLVWNALPDETENIKSALDIMFDVVKSRDPDSAALEMYQLFGLADISTRRKALFMAAGCLRYFMIPVYNEFTQQDNLNLREFRSEKQALLIKSSENSSICNFISTLICYQIQAISC